jgi:SAM-dependent methyltransferase
MERSPGQPESYLLRGGQAGAAQLRLINRIKWPTTEQLLNKAGLQAGMRVLDIGCGGGAVTLRMAALVGPEGEVVGTDLDPSVLRLAQQEAEDLNLPVTFHHLGTEELEEVAAYDFVYARYLLSHLAAPRAGRGGHGAGAATRRPAGRRGYLLSRPRLLSTKRRLRSLCGALPGRSARQGRRPGDRSTLDGHGTGCRASRRASRAGRARLSPRRG